MCVVSYINVIERVLGMYLSEDHPNKRQRCAMSIASSPAMVGTHDMDADIKMISGFMAAQTSEGRDETIDFARHRVDSTHFLRDAVAKCDGARLHKVTKNYVDSARKSYSDIEELSVEEFVQGAENHGTLLVSIPDIGHGDDLTDIVKIHFERVVTGSTADGTPEVKLYGGDSRSERATIRFSKGETPFVILFEVGRARETGFHAGSILDVFLT